MHRAACAFALALAATQVLALPWRERRWPLDTALPRRLIDAIMARGNWDILFEESPFAEFRRQLAMAVHYSLRGASKEAEFYFRKAETALAIAYASLRGRFGWPRSPDGLRLQDLPWGENRNTFSDYILCRLQLYLESALQNHDDGELQLEKLTEKIAQAERQLGKTLEQADPELQQFVRIMQTALAVRARNLSAAAQAEEFAATSLTLLPPVRGYWSRRALLFLIAENLHWGNLALAQSLLSTWSAAVGGDADPLMHARLRIRALDFTIASAILEHELERPENRSAENFPEFVFASEMLQNVWIWQQQYARAAQLAAQTHSWLSELVASDKVAREQLLLLRQLQADQKLRWQMLAFLENQNCPQELNLAEEFLMAPEWRIRERSFYELCGLARSNTAWQALLADKNLSEMGKEAILFRDGKIPPKSAADSSSPNTPLRIFWTNYPKYQSGKLSDTSALFAAWAELPKDFVFLDWGFVLPELPADFGALRKREQIWSLFSALQRRLFLRHFRDRAQVLAPGDAASFARLADAWLLGKEYPTLPPVSASSGQLIFADDERALVYAPDRRKRTVLTVLRSSPEKLQFMPGEVVWLFGYAQLWASRFPDSVVLQAAPLFARCEDCKRAQRTPARLLATSSSLWQKTVAELAALYTLSQPLAAAEPCQTPQDFFRDTLLITGNELFACHIAPENLVVSITESQTRLLPVLLSAAGRKNSAILFIPPQMPEDVRTAVLFDFLLRRTEYNLPPRAALKATQERLKKSFPAEAALAGLRIYAAPE